MFVYRHLTDTEYLMQEDLRQLIKALLNKEKRYQSTTTERKIHAISKPLVKLFLSNSLLIYLEFILILEPLRMAKLFYQ